MSFVLAERPRNRREEMWNWGEQRAIAVMTAMNLATVALVETIGLMIASDGWAGSGISSVESWVCWKANVSRHRAEGLCRIARRAEDLPICWDLFVQGRLTEDAMVRIAGKVPTSRDREVGDLALAMSIAQLTRVLSTLPELDPKPEPGRPPTTSCACAPPTTARSTTATSPSTVTPKPGRSGSTTPSGDRSSHPAWEQTRSHRRNHQVSSRSDPPAANDSTHATSAGTDTPQVRPLRRDTDRDHLLDRLRS